MMQLSFAVKHERRESHDEAFKIWPLHLDFSLLASATTRKGSYETLTFIWICLVGPVSGKHSTVCHVFHKHCCVLLSQHCVKFSGASVSFFLITALALSDKESGSMDSSGRCCKKNNLNVLN